MKAGRYYVAAGRHQSRPDYRRYLTIIRRNPNHVIVCSGSTHFKPFARKRALVMTVLGSEVGVINVSFQSNYVVLLLQGVNLRKD
jgi:hypothetical protein